MVNYVKSIQITVLATNAKTVPLAGVIRQTILALVVTAILELSVKTHQVTEVGRSLESGQIVQHHVMVVLEQEQDCVTALYLNSEGLAAMALPLMSKIAALNSARSVTNHGEV